MTAIVLQHVAMLPAASSSGGAGSYVDWGVVHVSVSNLLIVILMLVTFVVAMLIPFPGSGEEWAPAPMGNAEEPGAQP